MFSLVGAIGLTVLSVDGNVHAGPDLDVELRRVLIVLHLVEFADQRF